MSRLITKSLLALSALLAAPQLYAANVGEAPMGEAVERHMADDGALMDWVQDPDAGKIEQGDTLETREVVSDALETIKLSSLVPPIRFQTGVADIPESTVESLADILERMQDRINVRLHLIGHADNQPLSPELIAIYGDNSGLSRERAGMVAEHFQTQLTLPPEAISFGWAGDTLPVASNDTAEGRALNRRVEVEVWYDEVTEKVSLEEFLVEHEIRRIKVCRMETVCKLRYVDGHAQRARIQNLVPPLHFSDEMIDVDTEFVEYVRQSLENLSNKENVVVRFVGFTDNTPLSGRAERIYGSPLGLSSARARRVALAIQEKLGLPTAAVESDGQGASRPLGSNNTVRGRALNRRVEVEFWYDDPLQELPDEPQLCPESAGAGVVTKLYDPSWGRIDDIQFADGRPAIPAGYTAKLARALADIADKTNPRLRFVGYTRNERLARRTAAVYGDDVGLSTSRARRTMELVGEQMQLSEEQAEFEGRGYVHSEDVVNAGFVQGETSHVSVEVIYDDLAILDDYEGVDITRITRELSPQNPLGLNLMRITVDGIPIDDPKRSSSDIQRCTDVAMLDADIQFSYDNLRSAPRLSVAVDQPRIVVEQSAGGESQASPVRFKMYSNYSHFIAHSEVRVFTNGQPLESEPLDVIGIGEDGIAHWNPPAVRFTAPMHELAYVLRAYGTEGNFDETRPQPLRVLYNSEDSLLNSPDTPDTALLSAYGESGLYQHNIGLGSGTVSVRGNGLEPGQEVWVAGRPVPVDEKGSFISEEILPEGAHSVEVAIVDEQGDGNLYLRDFELKPNDWFYVGMADLTVFASEVSGPIDLLQGDNAPTYKDSNAHGRFAFFIDGKFGEHWKLTASADTKEGPLGDVFGNLMDKSPDALFRRLDTDYYYPEFGDDSTVEEMAPTMGKFFVRLSDGDNLAQWGNFKIGYMDNELAQVDRGLYGANLHYQTKMTTDFGEQRGAADVFVAEPGTVPSREEFRGTGGSLYFLRRQDILPGSERVRIELRDKLSGVVTGAVTLAHAMDYDIDYLQGRIVLAEPLASTVDDSLLVRSGAVSGDEAHLVVRYEYTPDFGDIDAMSTGGQAHYWIGDYVRAGVTMNTNEQDGFDSSLNGANLTFRMAAATWLKVQQATSEGLVSMPLVSSDGGFEFNSYDSTAFVNATADASRIDLSVSSNELIGSGDAVLTFFAQDVGAGYSAPGLTALTDTTSSGGTFSMQVADRYSINAKAANTAQELGLETSAYEVNVGYRISDHWDVDVGYRMDERTDLSPTVALTQRQGERADAVLQFGYDSKSTWSSHAFLQDTLSVTGNRQENARAGVGGSYRMSERTRLDAEVSGGNLGTGGKVGVNYLYSEHTSTYLNYALGNENNANGFANTPGREGNLVAGIKSRIADSTSVFLEERYQHSNTRTGLTHATGISFSLSEKWNIGINTDIGTLQDTQTGAETDRLASGIQVSFGGENLKFSSAVEYRNDDAEQADLSRVERTTLLFKNNLQYNISPAARVIGKLNHSDSESSLGTFYDGGFTEAVLGYAYRPVDNDRLNTLVKYTYFYNVPTTDQITLQNVAAEFIQKSHVAAVDISYDLTPTLSIGGKYAYRLGQVSLDRESSVFFDNNASLYVIRADYEFRENWEVLAEGRMLNLSDLDETRSGALITVSRYLGEHLKIGLGYNFTDFSADLTDLSYDNHGVFLNLTGSM